MKKIYQQPQTLTVHLQGEKAIMGILSNNAVTVDTNEENSIGAGQEWTKGDNTASYNVWDDDWSK